MQGNREDIGAGAQGGGGDGEEAGGGGGILGAEGRGVGAEGSGGEVVALEFAAVEVEDGAVGHGAVEAQSGEGWGSGVVEGAAVEASGGGGDGGGGVGAGESSVEAVRGFQVGADGGEIGGAEFAAVDEEFGDIAVEAGGAGSAHVASDVEPGGREGRPGIGVARFERAVDPQFEAVGGAVAAQGHDLERGLGDWGSGGGAAQAEAAVVAFLPSEAAADRLEGNQGGAGGAGLAVEEIGAGGVGDQPAEGGGVGLDHHPITKAAAGANAREGARAQLIVAVEAHRGAAGGSGLKAQGGGGGPGAGALGDPVGEGFVLPSGQGAAVGHSGDAASAEALD